MSAGVALDVAIVVVVGVVVLAGLVALRVHALDHPQQRDAARPRSSIGAGAVPLAVSALFQAQQIGRAPLAVRGAASAFAVATVLLLILGGVVWDRELRRRSADPVPSARRIPGRGAAALVTAGVVAGVIEGALLDTLVDAIGVPLGIALVVVVVLALARGWRRYRPARFAPHP